VFFSIQTSNGLAIYDQIVRQIKFAIAGEAIRADELVPSVRELSRQLAINPNTVARAYRQLQDEGVLESVRGRGLRVAKDAQRQCRADRLQLIRERLQRALAEARQSGLERAEIEQLVQKAIRSLT
jgi:GntR family transcriptional regulator